MPHLTNSQEFVAPPRSASLSSLLAAWLCAATGLGCPAVQVKPPAPADCPEDARRAMFEELKLTEGQYLRGILDIHQPGSGQEEGLYRDGPIVGRVVRYDYTDPALPGGTLLYGQLWTGIQDQSLGESVIGRYTRALLPDGRMVPVCIVVGGPEGRWPTMPGSKPGAAVLGREVSLAAVSSWP